MALLKIVRNPRSPDRFRAYQIFLDGKRISTIRNGQTKELSVSPGQHELSARIDWCGSNALRFTISEGEKPVFLIQSNFRKEHVLMSLWTILFERNSYVNLDRAT